MMKIFARLSIILAILPGMTSCLLDTLALIEDTMSLPNILEPNYQVTFTLNGEEYKHTSQGLGQNGYVSFTRRFINSDKFLDIHVSADTPTLSSNGLYLKLTTDEDAFIQHKKYPLESCCVVNKYGHLCEMSGEWEAYFNLDGLKSYESFEVFFEADCLDPDTQEVYLFRNGRILCCKNSFLFHSFRDNLPYYIKAD